MFNLYMCNWLKDCKHIIPSIFPCFGLLYPSLYPIKEEDIPLIQPPLPSSSVTLSPIKAHISINEFIQKRKQKQQENKKPINLNDVIVMSGDITYMLLEGGKTIRTLHNSSSHINRNTQYKAKKLFRIENDSWVLTKKNTFLLCKINKWWSISNIKNVVYIDKKLFCLTKDGGVNKYSINELANYLQRPQPTVIVKGAKSNYRKSSVFFEEPDTNPVCQICASKHYVLMGKQNGEVAVIFSKKTNEEIQIFKEKKKKLIEKQHEVRKKQTELERYVADKLSAKVQKLKSIQHTNTVDDIKTKINTAQKELNENKDQIKKHAQEFEDFNNEIRKLDEEVNKKKQKLQKPIIENVTQMDAGDDHSVFLTNNRKVFVYFDELQEMTKCFSNDIIYIKAGPNHTFFVDNFYKVFVCGQFMGKNYKAPTLIDSLMRQKITQVVSGKNQAIFANDQGELFEYKNDQLVELSYQLTSEGITADKKPNVKVGDNPRNSIHL